MSQHVIRHTVVSVTTVMCPKCGDVIVYNGNFFCNSRDAIEYDKARNDVFLSEGTCDWALPHPAVSKKDRGIVDELHWSGAMPEIDYR